MEPQPPASKSDALKRMLEEDDVVEDAQVDEDYGGEVVLPDLVFNKSTDSLGACSQRSFYPGDDDFENTVGNLATDLFGTQPNNEEQPSDSSSSSDSSLGKRKASDLSSMSSVDLPKASKIPRPIGFSAKKDTPRKLAHVPTVPVLAEAGPSSKPLPTEFSSAADNPFKLEVAPTEPALAPVVPLSKPICITPPHHMQKAFNARNMPYGAQYEIARYVSIGKTQYSNILVPNVLKLAEKGTNREAVPAVPKSILTDTFDEDDVKDDDIWKKAFAKEQASKSPWEELDREEAALLNNPYGCLGFNDKEEFANWHGGKILFHGKLQDISPKTARSPPEFKLTLERAELGTSNMFARRFGSKHFFRLKLTKPVTNTKHPDALIAYLCRPLILCGSVFRVFHWKDTNVFYVKTNEVTQGETILENEKTEGVMSYMDFLNWHNNMRLNNKQTMAKYFSRFALGLSNSVPGLIVDQENIRFIDDIVSAETGSNMTDGAGKINRWSLMQIRHRLNWEDRPTAIQTRIFGTKGLLIDDGKNAEEYAYVEVTPSQQKIQFPQGEPIDLAHRIIDVLRASHTKVPCRLSVETIVCLAENGVGRKVFFQLLQKALQELVEPLSEWETQEDMRTLWSIVRRLGGVMAARRAREEAGLARVNGYSEKEAEDNELEDEDGFDDKPEQDSVAWWGDEISGCPSSLEETIMYMLDSGFTPKECPVLRDKLQKFIKGRVSHYVKSYRIDVPMSASAFMVPDTSGKLKPGQIFFKSSRRELNTVDGSKTDMLLGRVLVTRHPCKLPTDMQMMECVDIPELHHLVDVIVFSTQGTRRQADLLAGGDYDGDKGTLIFQPEIVNAFKNAPLHFSEPPKDINTYFHRENLDVATFEKKIEGLDEVKKILAIQKCLLDPIRNMSVVGKYSTFHDIATYTLGYDHETTIRLAYMFCMTLDGIKSGMTVLQSVLDSDTRQFQKRSPQWKESEEERARVESNNEAHVKRPGHLNRFIMDDLYKQARTEGEHWLTELDKRFTVNNAPKLDSDLAGPWKRALEQAERWKKEEKSNRMADDLEKIKRHVESQYTAHRSEMSSPRKPTRNTPKKNGSSFTDLPIEVRQNKIRTLSLNFNSSPSVRDVLMSEEDINRLRASYAYYYDFDFRKGYTSRFPFDVAMRELCAIKARALGRLKAVSGDFYDHFNMKHPKQHHH